MGRAAFEDPDNVSGALSWSPGYLSPQHNLSPQHTDLPLLQMLLSLPQLPWNQQTGKSWCALRLQGPPEETTRVPALALKGYPNSRRLAPSSQAQRL